jgi:hypothetical protein
MSMPTDLLHPDFDMGVSLDHETRSCLRLWAAVFAVGIQESAETVKDGREPYWFYADDHYPGSFVWLCELFDLEPERARSEARMRFREIIRKANAKQIKDAKRAVLEEQVPPVPTEVGTDSAGVHSDIHVSRSHRRPRSKGAANGGEMVSANG